MKILWLVCLISPLMAAEGGGALRLSLRRAVEMATSADGNARVRLAEEAVQQARSKSAQARAALLPDLSAGVAEQNQTRNLAAMGISVSVPIPGFHFPEFVGPFNTFDARVNAQQSVFDFASIRRYQASRAGVAAAGGEARNAGEQVGALVARAYVAALKSEADVEAVKANIALAEAVLKQTRNQKAAGTGTGIEITRAGVQLAHERQRLMVVEAARRRARLELLRAMGVRLDTEFELTGRLEFTPAGTLTLEQARRQALEERADLKAQREREETARLSAHATRMERLPTVAGFADYGSSGTGMNHALPTRTYGVALRLPVFDGGRRDARRGESASLYRQEQLRTRDLAEQIELEVRTALDSLDSAAGQVQVAEEGLSLADSELTQARRRYDAGVANSLEVTDAQTRLERARDNRIAALFNYQLARIDTALATGAVRRVLE
jgi:outer membrane protein TolC